MRPSDRCVYIVTCGTCGQTWERTHARMGDASECVFCGVHGWIRLGAPSEVEPDQQRIHAWLEPPVR